MARRTDECKIALTGRPEETEDHHRECPECRSVPVWSVYAYPDRDDHLDAEWADMDEVAANLTLDAALERAAELGLVPIGL